MLKKRSKYKKNFKNTSPFGFVIIFASLLCFFFTCFVINDLAPFREF